jgi:hypothetical protein
LACAGCNVAQERKSSYSKIVRLLRDQASTDIRIFSIVDSVENKCARRACETCTY